VVRKPFTVVEGPAHYNSARRHKDEATGLTVRNMTYEVRRYFQKTPEDPGVLISMVEPGSKASVAGIKPFEIITAVNDQPVHDVREFQKLITGGGELRLAVKRMTQGRVVKIRLAETADTQPAASAAPED